jgi:predicted protein tyrosine phosphatase
MFKWFHKNALTATRAVAPIKVRHIRRADPAPASPGIRFNPKLIKQFRAEHRQLLTLFKKAKRAAESAHWTEVEALLATFHTVLTEHLISESVRLYVYLKQRVADNPDELQLMRSFASEMSDIGKLVVDFLDSQRGLSRSPAKQSAFLTMWMDIGHTLSDRIAREENTLYPMYQNNR